MRQTFKEWEAEHKIEWDEAFPLYGKTTYNNIECAVLLTMMYKNGLEKEGQVVSAQIRPLKQSDKISKISGHTIIVNFITHE